MPLPFINFNENVAFKLFGTIGNQYVERYVNYGIPNNDYWDWQLGATATVYGVDLTIAYIDTNIDVADCLNTYELRRPRLSRSARHSKLPIASGLIMSARERRPADMTEGPRPAATAGRLPSMAQCTWRSVRSRRRGRRPERQPVGAGRGRGRPATRS